MLTKPEIGGLADLPGATLRFSTGRGTGIGSLKNIEFFTANLSVTGTNIQSRSPKMILFGPTGNLSLATVPVDDTINKLQVDGSIKATQFRLSALNTNEPNSSNSPGTTGEIRITSYYIYICVGPNQWRRASLVEF